MVEQLRLKDELRKLDKTIKDLNRSIEQRNSEGFGPGRTQLIDGDDWERELNAALTRKFEVTEKLEQVKKAWEESDTPDRQCCHFSVQSEG